MPSIAGRAICVPVRETLNRSFDKPRTNDRLLIPFVVSLSNHERNQAVQHSLK